MERLGFGLIAKGKLVEAESMLNKCLKMYRESYGRNTNHYSIANTLFYLRDLWMRRGKLDMAQSKYDECLEMDRNIYGHDTNHPSIATTLYSLGDFWMRRGKLDMAQWMFDECLEMRRVLYGRDTNHPEIGTTLCYLGYLWVRRGKLDMAQSMYDECLEMYRNIDRQYLVDVIQLMEEKNTKEEAHRLIPDMYATPEHIKETLAKCTCTFRPDNTLSVA